MSIEVYFSPKGGCDRALKDLIREARLTVEGACFSLSNHGICRELIAARKRGVVVRMMVDRSQTENIVEGSSHLAHEDIPVRVNRHRGLMHCKFLIADRKHIATGSFNWTDPAIKINDENMVIFRDEPDLANVYLAHYEGMWQDNRRFEAL